MPGIIDMGRDVRRQALSGLSQVSRMETDRANTNASIRAQEDAGKGQLAGQIGGMALSGALSTGVLADVAYPAAQALGLAAAPTAVSTTAVGGTAVGGTAVGGTAVGGATVGGTAVGGTAAGAVGGTAAGAVGGTAAGAVGGTAAGAAGGAAAGSGAWASFLAFLAY
jgi:hypothetical protein